MGGAEDSEEIVYIRPNVSVHSFETQLASVSVLFEVVKFKDTVHLWIGDKRARSYKELSFAIPSRYSNDPMTTKIIGPHTEIISTSLALKLSKKLKKPVYVSFNLVDDRITVPEVNKRLNEEIKNNPHIFGL